jgi:ATP-dependent helicase/nuclease subunit A
MGARKLTNRTDPPDRAARRRAVEDEGHNILLQAGAGSGKTTTLIDRLAWLLSERGAELSRIVAITFTEKAAGELKDRLRDLCDTKVETAGSPDEANRWRAHRRSIDTAHVGTIHGFCSRLLRAHALRLGIDPLSEVLDEAQARLLLQDTMRRFAIEGLRAGRPAIRALIASLGLTRLVEALVFVATQRAKVTPAALADSPEGVLERWRRVQAEQAATLLPQLRRDPNLPAAVGLLRAAEPRSPEDDLAKVRDEALRAAEGALDESLDASDSLAHWGVLANLRKVGNTGRKTNWPPDAIGAVRAAIGTLRDAAQPAKALLPADEVAEESAATLTAHSHALVPEALRAYAAAKRERSAVDFDDQLLLARELLRDHVDARQAEQDRFDYLLVDEFQDTDPIQREIIWYLAEQGASASCPKEVILRPGKLMVVGDAKQSIYGFRGADVTVYNDTRASFAAQADAACLTLSLSANFRSQARLVSFFNGFFSHDAVMGRHTEGRERFEAHYEPLEATRRPAEDGVDVAFILAPGEDENLEELRMRAADGIARYIADAVLGGQVKVARTLDDGAETWEPAAWKDIMVLLPTMTSVQLYERALREHRVPYYVVAGKGFFARPEVMDVVALLKALDEPRDELSLARALRAPWCGLSDEGLYWLARDGGLAEGLRACEAEGPGGLSPTDADRARRATTMLAQLRSARHHVPLADLLERVLDETALPSVAATRFDGARAYANLRKLVEIARDFEASGPVLLSRFIEQVETLRLEEVRQSEAPAEEEQGDAVTLMTIHKAKGLQRPIVVVADLATGGGSHRREAIVLHPEAGPVLKGETKTAELAFPPVAQTVIDAEAARETAEDRRLLYVALTRARDRLVISTPVQLDKERAPKGGVWVQALLAALGDQLLTGDSIAGSGEFGEWSGEVIRVEGPAVGARGTRPLPLLAQYRPQIETAEPIPGGDEAEEAAIVARMRPVGPDLAARTRFTVTELSAHLHCPRCYYLRYVRGLAGFSPAAEAPAPGRLRPDERGTVVHRALQRLGRGPVSEVRDEVEAAMQECGLAGHDPGEVESILAMLVRFTGSETWELIRTAKELRSEVPIVAPLGGGLIEGQIDALVRDWNEALHLLDYKTGRAQDAGTLDEHRFQIGAYAAAVEQARGDLPATLAIHYLASNERVELDPAGAAAAATEQATEAISGIRAGDFPRRPDCEVRDCPYAWICESSVR